MGFPARRRFFFQHLQNSGADALALHVYGKVEMAERENLRAFQCSGMLPGVPAIDAAMRGRLRMIGAQMLTTRNAALLL